MTLTVILSVIAGLAVGVLIGFMYQKNASDKKYKGALSESERVISEAVKKAEQMKRDIVSEGKEEIHRLRQELDRDTKERRNELQRSERRLEQKEENLDRKIESISRKEEELIQKHEQAQEKLNVVFIAKRNESSLNPSGFANSGMSAVPLMAWPSNFTNHCSVISNRAVRTASFCHALYAGSPSLTRSSPSLSSLSG